MPERLVGAEIPAGCRIDGRPMVRPEHGGTIGEMTLPRRGIHGGSPTESKTFRSEPVKKQSTRRAFLKHMAAGGLAVPFFSPRLTLANPANGKLNHASIGVGGMGGSDLNSFLRHDRFQLIAIADVDKNTLNAVKQRFPDVRAYQDWRELLANEGDRIDSINIATPDHMHAPITMTALNMGKHVYCQKPLCQTVYEARQVGQAAVAKPELVTQMGNQIHSHIAYRMAVQMLRDGAIGKIREFHSWVGAPGGSWPQPVNRPAGEDPVPAHLDWDLWVGVAPMRPYKHDVYAPFKWRGWKDFGGGGLGDFGCHIFDPPFTALQPGAPISVTVEAPHVYDESWPEWEIVRYIFPGNDMTEGKELPVTWYDGGKRPPRELAQLPEGRDLPGAGSLIIGTEGQMVLPHVGGPQLYPQEKFTNYERPRLEHVDHYFSFVDACLGKGKTGSHFGYAGPLSEAVQLGNVANRFPGKTLQWDAKNLKVTNLPEANQYLRREYRKGWEVKGL